MDISPGVLLLRGLNAVESMCLSWQLNHRSDCPLIARDISKDCLAKSVCSRPKQTKKTTHSSFGAPPSPRKAPAAAGGPGSYPPAAPRTAARLPGPARRRRTTPARGRRRSRRTGWAVVFSGGMTRTQTQAFAGARGGGGLCV